ncbi:MAG: PRC-barrel domain containing protein [Clostridia bacterium]|jgi:sporulation protein YlmC with PRC-barrel domain|nr:PRC-barrel domain containing protein [Clostridia bacterium]
MEFTFCGLKQKEVISLNDGKNLGRVCDITFSFPENNLLGLTVTGGRGFKFTRQEIFIPMRSVVKIGEDAVLVKLDDKSDKPEKPDKRPPKHNCCPPPCPPYNCPPDRRSYDEYE